MDKRKHLRLGKKHLQVDVSDGVGFFSGSINNLSRFGLCLMDLPGRIDDKVKRLSVVITDDGSNFKMLARPRWAKSGKYKKDIGVEIINAPWGWTEYVMSHEPLPEDPWSDMYL